MRTAAENTALCARLALEMLLIVTAGTAIFAPELRTAILKTVVTVLFLTQGAVVTYCGWKNGNLRLTPSQLFYKMRQTGGVKRSRLETLAVFAGFVAVVVITWP